MSILDSARDEIDKIVAEIPEKKKGILTAGVTLEGARVEIGTWLAPNWSLGAFAEKEFKGGQSAGIVLHGSW